MLFVLRRVRAHNKQFIELFDTLFPWCLHFFPHFPYYSSCELVKGDLLCPFPAVEESHCWSFTRLPGFIYPI